MTIGVQRVFAIDDPRMYHGPMHAMVSSEPAIFADRKRIG